MPAVAGLWDCRGLQQAAHRARAHALREEGAVRSQAWRVWARRKGLDAGPLSRDGHGRRQAWERRNLVCVFIAVKRT